MVPSRTSCLRLCSDNSGKNDNKTTTKKQLRTAVMNAGSVNSCNTCQLVSMINQIFYHHIGLIMIRIKGTMEFLEANLIVERVKSIQ